MYDVCHCVGHPCHTIDSDKPLSPAQMLRRVLHSPSLAEAETLILDGFPTEIPVGISVGCPHLDCHS